MHHTTTATKMILDRWDASVKNGTALLDSLSDAQLQQQVAPGKNRGIYLLSHLIAVHDDLAVLLGLGQRCYPQLRAPFLESPDNPDTPMPTIPELKAIWADQCRRLAAQFATLQPGQWFEKHTAVSNEDFAQEPHRNRLNIVLTRTTHLAYHTAQLHLLK